MNFLDEFMKWIAGEDDSPPPHPSTWQEMMLPMI
jgi:hypothetical protein